MQRAKPTQAPVRTPRTAPKEAVVEAPMGVLSVEQPTTTEEVKEFVYEAPMADGEGRIDGILPKAWLEKGVKWFPLDVGSLISAGYIDYGCHRFAFREVTYGDMKKLARLSETANEMEVVFEVLADMTYGIDVSLLDPSDARYLLFYIRSLSLTDPNFYLRYTCAGTDENPCKAINPFSFHPSEFEVNRLTKRFNGERKVDVNGEEVVFKVYGIDREADVESLINHLTIQNKQENAPVQELLSSYADAKMAGHIHSWGGEELSIFDAYDRLITMPFSAMRELVEFLNTLPNYGFKDQVDKTCYSCGKTTKVRIGINKLFFFQGSVLGH